LRIEGLLRTWIHILLLPWLQKPPSCGSHENLNKPLLDRIVSVVFFARDRGKICVSGMVVFQFVCLCIWGSKWVHCFACLPCDL
jgi:hypothetical protein